MKVPKEIMDMKEVDVCLAPISGKRERVVIRKQPRWRCFSVVVLARIKSSHTQAFDDLRVALCYK